MLLPSLGPHWFRRQLVSSTILRRVRGNDRSCRISSIAFWYASRFRSLVSSLFSCSAIRSLISYGEVYWVPPTNLNLQKWSIASPHCGRSETVPHLLWTCSFTTAFVQRLHASLSHKFLGRRFGKHFWLFGQILCTLSNNAYFLQWTRFSHSRPFWWPTIIRTLIKTDCMKLAYLSNPSRNLYLMVYNLETSHYKFTLFTLSASKLFSV